MNKKIFIAVAIAAVSILASALIAYVWNFGSHLSNDREHWGQFGDYFGGLLNPTFSLLAFFALLWSIKLQDQELKETSKNLVKQAEDARQEIQHIHNDRLTQELMLVIRNIDDRIDRIFGEVISPDGALPQLTIAQMNAEAERLAVYSGHSPAYVEFIKLANSKGSVIEAKTREILYLISSMRSFLEQYSLLMDGKYVPTICYYGDKIYRMLHLAEDIGGLPADTREFFATVSDKHG